MSQKMDVCEHYSLLLQYLLVLPTLERSEVSRIVLEFLVRKVDDIGNHSVEKLSVVRNNQDGVLEPFDVIVSNNLLIHCRIDYYF